MTYNNNKNQNLQKMLTIAVYSGMRFRSSLTIYVLLLKIIRMVLINMRMRIGTKIKIE